MKEQLDFDSRAGSHLTRKTWERQVEKDGLVKYEKMLSDKAGRQGSGEDILEAAMEGVVEWGEVHGRMGGNHAVRGSRRDL